MGQRPTVRWNETAGRWMAWVRFPDGSRRKVERVEKADAQGDLDELLALRAQSLDPGPRRTRQATFDEVIDAWFEDGCPNVAPTRSSRHARTKSPNTVTNARQLLATSVRPVIGKLWVDRTSTERLEKLFADMANDGLRHQHRRSHLELSQPGPAARAAPPPHQGQPGSRRAAAGAPGLEAPQELHHRPGATPAGGGDPRPTAAPRCGSPASCAVSARASWLGCGGRSSTSTPTRPTSTSSSAPSRSTTSTPARWRPRRSEVDAGSAFTRSWSRPCGVTATRCALLGLYDDEGFVFCTRNGTPMTLNNLRRAFQQLCARAGLGSDWTTYELRHSFVSLVADQLDDLVKVADLAGHVDTRTTEGYRHAVRPSLPHAIDAWDQLLEHGARARTSGQAP